MIVSGSNINFDQDGNYLGIMDANSITQMIDYLISKRGRDPAKYITPPPPRYTA